MTDRAKLADAIDPRTWPQGAEPTSREYATCLVTDLIAASDALRAPIPMYLTCPKCNARHIDEGDFATKPHHTHSCQSCGLTWQPAVVATVGVKFLPGFKNPPQVTHDR